MPYNLYAAIGGVSHSMPYSWVHGCTFDDAYTTNIESGSIYPYVKGVAVYHCPTDSSKIASGTAQRLRSYSLSIHLNSVPDRNGVGPTPLTRMTGLTNPASIFCFIDEHEKTIEDGVFGIMPAPGTQWINLAADRHGQAANLTYADGHAGKHRWKAKKIYVSQWQTVSGPDDAEDLKFLQGLIQ
jgi:prepilin-type processing-associated H-X9-DG protein